MNKIEFDYIKRKDGSSEFEEFFDRIPPKEAIKLLTAIQKIETCGLAIAIKMEWVKKLNHDLSEVRSKFGSNITRVIYFKLCGNKYMMTHGFSKKTQRTPRNEIVHAANKRKRFLERLENE